MDIIRARVKRIIYAIGGLIILLILIRFGFKLLGVSPQIVFANIIYQLTEIFVSPFYGIATDLQSGNVTIEASALIALIMWLAFILIIAELVTAFLYDHFADIIINLVDAFFKFVEFFLLARLLMRAFGVQLGVNGFVDAIYNIAGIVYEPFAGLAPGIDVGIGVIELSTLIALIIVIFLDIVTEGILTSVLEGTRVERTIATTTMMPQTVYVPQQPATPPPQINVIMPQAPQSQPIFVHNAQTGETMQIDPSQQPSRIVIDAPSS